MLWGQGDTVWIWKRPYLPNLEGKMIDVGAADKLLRDCHISMLHYDVATESLAGKILAKPLFAKREQPPFHRVAMDGIALNFKNNQGRVFLIEGIQKAGQAPLSLKKSENVLEVMTGAVLPIGTDTVIPYEHCFFDGEKKIHLKKETIVQHGQNIHKKGSDYAEGELLLESGVKLNCASIAIIAAQGMERATVIKFPKVALVSTGDELRPLGEKCEPWQIWRSNSFALKAELMSFGQDFEEIDLFHLEDDRKSILSKLSSLLKKYEVIILSGGVSMGKYDFIHSVMGELGVTTQFHKIKQRPGKPMLFGTGAEGQFIFGLPGNPVSALVCMRRYVISWLEHSLKQKNGSYLVALGEDIRFKKNFVLFSPVKIRKGEDAKLLAKPLSSNGSGDFASLSLSDGFIELPAEKEHFKRGEIYTFYPWKGVFA